MCVCGYQEKEKTIWVREKELNKLDIPHNIMGKEIFDEKYSAYKIQISN
jgi:hypothetical protein